MIPFVKPSAALSINLLQVTRTIDHPAENYIEVYLADGTCQEYQGQDAALLRGVIGLWANHFGQIVNQLATAGNRIVAP